MSDSILTHVSSDINEDEESFRKSHISGSQFGLMVDYMTLNPELVNGNESKRPNEVKVWREKWEELASLLNADLTGPKKDAIRWRKSFQDQKKTIKSKAIKREEYVRLEGSDAGYRLTDLEERVLKLINYKPVNVHKTVASNNVVKNLTVQNVRDEISNTNYIVLDVNEGNVPILIESSNQSFSKFEPGTVFIELDTKNTVLTGRETSGAAPISVEKTNNISIHSAITSDLKRLQNVNRTESGLKISNNTSETQTKTIQELKEGEKSSKPIVNLKPCEVSRKTTIDSSSNINQDPLMLEKTSTTGKAKENGRIRKFRARPQPYFHRKDEPGIVSLLIRQNQLLEGIAKSLARIEKSVNDRSPEVQRNNNMLINTSENMEKLADSVGTVSKSLKSIVTGS